MTDWSLIYEGFEPRQEKLREALCTLGNGYFATRGAAPESTADEVHYPGTYLAGGYNRLGTMVKDHEVENEDLVNLPNWLPLSFSVNDGEWFSPGSAELLDYRQELNVHQGILIRMVRLRDAQGNVTRCTQRRLVHMRYPHLAALETTLEPENWSGRLRVRSALDGRVVNGNVARYQDLNNQHLEPLAAESSTDDNGQSCLFLRVRTKQSRLEIAEAATTRFYRNAEFLSLEPQTRQENSYIAHDYAMDIEAGEVLTVEKTVALYTSRDFAISECGLEARNAVCQAGRFAELAESHAQFWQQLWRRFELDITATQTPYTERSPALILRLHLFHLLQTVSPNTMNLDIGVPARGWHGEAYRGHIFWDELFIFPLLNLRLPEITRALILYRYRRLDAARRAAREAGYRGAMFPWQSGSDGREESQKVHLNPNSGRWIPDRSRLQHHVNAAIAYNVWQYYQVTGDMEFMAFYGAEMLLEIARFWASIASYNEDLDRYEILGVMGPDEYHEAYPDSEGDKGGLDNNAYTNVMAAWVLERALELLNLLPEERRQELQEMLDLGGEELQLWDTISRRMRVVFHEEGIVSQFEGYDRLEPFDWAGYWEKYGDIQRLDRILKAEDDTPDRYQVSKQADVLMLLYLFSSEELVHLFERLGYDFPTSQIPKNIDYYLQRTSHGSTLSRVVHSWVLARSDRTRSWDLFSEALTSDVADVQGGTTPEGIHLGAMAGTVDLVQRAYTGIVVREEVLWLHPALPEEISCLKLRVRYRGHALDINIQDDRLHLSVRPNTASPIKVGIHAQIHELRGGETREFTWNR